MTEPLSPFAPESADQTDQALVSRALAGDRQSLEALLGRHQPWIFNLAFRMVMVRQDAEDVTQEVLVKVLTKLSGYDAQKSSFRTWLYRIVTNHIINMKTRGYEKAIRGFDSYYAFVDTVPDQDPEASPETERIVADLTIACVMGTLLCLDREQRLAFILVVAFNVSSEIGAELLDVSPDAFRKTLSRARARLQQYMQGHCGLVNPDAPCHCRRKVKSFVESGAYSATKLHFLAEQRPKMREIVGETISHFDQAYGALFRSHPFYAAPDSTAVLRALLDQQEFKSAFRLE
ncbi:MAG: RNA polymerase sigma factor [Myxococcales bacterium]